MYSRKSCSHDYRAATRREGRRQLRRIPTARGRRDNQRRAIRAARRAQEGQATKPRRLAPWALALGLLPILLVAVVGAYALTIISHTQRAVGKISQPSVADVVHGTSAPDLRPTNTPDAQHTIAPPPTLPPVPTALPAPQFNRKDPFTIMLLGVEDQRNGADDSSRSDTIILAYVDPLEKHVNLLSIPRDLRVTQPGGRGLAKMADVYANGDALKYKGVGGVAFVWDTVEQNFQVKIDYYVRANFDGFVKIVDTVGGVTVDNPYPIKDDSYPTADFQFTRVFFPAGIVHLDGAEALRYVRTRHDDSDFGRNARQQQVILSIREQAKRLNLLSHATELIDTLGDTFRTDLPTDQWIGMARFGIDLPSGAIQQFNLVDLLTTQTIGGIDYDIINWPQAVVRAREFSPKENFQAIQAQSTQGPNKAAKITVENGTRTAGLANRWATALQSKGFATANFIDAPPTVKGNIAKTRILYFGANKETAIAVAGAFGFDAALVADGGSKRPTEAPQDVDVLVILGNDAQDPGGG